MPYTLSLFFASGAEPLTEEDQKILLYTMHYEMPSLISEIETESGEPVPQEDADELLKELFDHIRKDPEKRAEALRMREIITVVKPHLEEPNINERLKKIIAETPIKPATDPTQDLPKLIKNALRK